jgi:hypothetical protein
MNQKKKKKEQAIRKVELWTETAHPFLKKINKNYNIH